MEPHTPSVPPSAVQTLSRVKRNKNEKGPEEERRRDKTTKGVSEEEGDFCPIVDKRATDDCAVAKLAIVRSLANLRKRRSSSPAQSQSVRPWPCPCGGQLPALRRRSPATRKQFVGPNSLSFQQIRPFRGGMERRIEEEGDGRPHIADRSPGRSRQMVQESKHPT